MQFIDCVEVYRDDLESEARMAECVSSMLRVLWEACSLSETEMNEDAGNVCWLLMQTMDEHAGVLHRAAEGRLTGPQMPKAGGAA